MEEGSLKSLARPASRRSLELKQDVLTGLCFPQIFQRRELKPFAPAARFQTTLKLKRTHRNPLTHYQPALGCCHTLLFGGSAPIFVIGAEGGLLTVAFFAIFFLSLLFSFVLT